MSLQIWGSRDNRHTYKYNKQTSLITKWFYGSSKQCGEWLTIMFEGDQRAFEFCINLGWIGDNYEPLRGINIQEKSMAEASGMKK